MQTVENQTIDAKELSKEPPKTDSIWWALKAKARLLGYGELVCRIVVHDGLIKEVDVERTVEKIR